MGQRSQMFVNAEIQAVDGEIKNHLTASYFQWRFGSSLVERAAEVVSWLKQNISGKSEDAEFSSQDFLFEMLMRNMDEVPHHHDRVDLVQEAIANGFDLPPSEDFFLGQDNDDGIIFIRLAADGNINYAFTAGYSDITPMSCDEYMKNGEYKPNEKYQASKALLESSATLMTEDDIRDFMQANYLNVKPEHISGREFYGVQRDFIMNALQLPKPYDIQFYESAEIMVAAFNKALDAVKSPETADWDYSNCGIDTFKSLLAERIGKCTLDELRVEGSLKRQIYAAAIDAMDECLKVYGYDKDAFVTQSKEENALKKKTPRFEFSYYGNEVELKCLSDIQAAIADMDEQSGLTNKPNKHSREIIE